MFSINNNCIYVYKKNGTRKRVSRFWGLCVKFKGKNSVINIYEPCKFKFQVGANRSHIIINGDNNVINLKADKFFKSLRIRAVGSNNIIDIGHNIIMTSGVDIDFANACGLNFKIGDNCLFGQNIKFMLGDYHTLFSTITREQVNLPKTGIEIGDNVWLARNVTFLKDTKISSNSIVGYGSLVTKKFDDSNVIIAGVPAKIVKRHVYWQT